ncbi:MAG: response regulator [Verrucomicrobiota bacterium]|nr:response regulator [Verrucomicrobiota bacterium]
MSVSRSQILIIDDDKVVRNLIGKVLAHEGYEVLEARDGAEGLQLYRKSFPDLVITDLVMPEKEGLETIREIRQAYPCVKVIAMSGGGRSGGEDYLKLATKLGATRTLTKPFLKDEMLALVEAVLEEQSTLTED